MNKFNLTFWGEILAGRDPQKVKARFAKMFSIDDPERVEHFFSGDNIILRRNLERKVAAEYYSKLRKLGIEVELVKVDPISVEKTPARSTPSPEPGPTPEGESDWEKARRLAELEAQQRKAQHAAEREESRRRAEAAAAQHKAEQEALKRQRTEAEARRRQEEATRAKEQAEAEARRKAELEARRQQQDKEAAERKAARDEARRRETEEAARRKAELDEQKRIAREEAAAEKARNAAEKRKAAEALTKQRALEAERKRQEEQHRKEQAAKEKARREEEKRKAAEALAKQRALEAEEKRQEEQRRKEQTAKERAHREEEKRKADEESARQRKLEAQRRREKEQKRKEQAAREKAEREAEATRLREKREAAQRAEKAKREAERARVAEERAQQRAERERRQAQEKQLVEEDQRAQEALEREQEAQRKLMEEQAIARAADELSGMAALKPAQGKVTSNLELPRRSSLPPKANRQVGAPNFYSMHPFRNTSEVRERADVAGKKKFTGLVAAAIALASLMILTGRYLGREPALPVTGPSAVAAAPSGALTMLAGDKLLLHDRAGVGTESVTLTDKGIPGAVMPFSYNASGDLLLHASPDNAGDSLTQLHRCSGDFADCTPVPVEGRADAMTTHPLTGEIFLARTGSLIKLSAEGEPLIETELPLPEKPIMLLDSGLLFINSRQGPAVSVYRYEDSAFGKQLDEILLLPPPAVEKEQTRVRDFVRAEAKWWVSLENPETESTGLYLFDSDWNFRSEIETGDDWARANLLTWGQKVLLWKDDRATIKRFAGSGLAEADLKSDLLASLIEQQQRSTQLKNLGWAGGFSLLIAIAVIGAALGYHQYLRSLVYHSRSTRGAESVDEFTENIQWVDPAADRAAAIKRLWLSYVALAAASVMLCIGLSVSLSGLAAALVALSGPAIALVLFERSQPTHVGTLEDKLILVDHRQIYHAASGSRIQYRGPFLLIDDVVIFAGSSALPAFSSEQLSSSVAPVAGAGTRVDRKTVLVKLLDARHPLAQGATITGIALLGSIIVLAAGQFL